MKYETKIKIMSCMEKYKDEIYEWRINLTSIELNIPIKSIEKFIESSKK